MYLGRNYVVVLADFPAVEDAFNQAATSNRPPGIFDFLPDGMGFSSCNGSAWAEQRRFAVKAMRDIGLGRTEWSNLVEDELVDFIKQIESKNGEPINIFSSLTTSISNNICSFLFGKRLPSGKDRDLLDISVDVIVLFFSHKCMWNYYPWFCNLLSKLQISRYHKAAKAMKAFNTFLRNEIETHKKTQGDSVEFDIISQYLEALDANKNKQKGENFTERNMVGSIQSLFIGGSDTTRTTLSWLFLTLAAYPDVQQKVYEELQTVLGKDPWASWEDRMKFPYTCAVLMESQRWKTLVPLNTSRWASEDTKICGYDIPKGTTLIANYWGLHNDPRYWKEPEKFIPERFLMNGGKEANFKAESFVPFSYGKRRCPGEAVALMELFPYFTAMMQRFEVRAPDGRQPNMDAVLGITYQPLPHKLCFIPRKQTM